MARRGDGIYLRGSRAGSGLTPSAILFDVAVREDARGRHHGGAGAADPARDAPGCDRALRRGGPLVMEYKGWEIAIQSKKAPDTDGWRVYVLVSIAAGAAVRTVPLSFRDGRAFATEDDATAAGAELARIWVDEKG
jgi:hypothetical protein